MTDLIAFPAARLDELETTAHYAGPARVAWLSLHDAAGNLRYTTVAAELGEDGGQGWVADGKELPAPAFARIVYDPARVLREVEAGRRILERHRDCATMTGYCRDRHVGPAPCPDLADLLTRWSGHPDYRQGWANWDSIREHLIRAVKTREDYLRYEAAARTLAEAAETPEERDYFLGRAELHRARADGVAADHCRSSRPTRRETVMTEHAWQKSWGQIAYEAYVKNCGGQAVNGDRLLSWGDQAANIQAHWDAAGLAVMREYRLSKEET